MRTTREGSQRDHARVDQVKFVAVVEHLPSSSTGTPGVQLRQCWQQEFNKRT